MIKIASKQELKGSEARIIVYLENSDKPIHYVRKIASKLDMDYGYCIKILIAMLEKGWLSTEKTFANPSRTYYHLTQEGKWKIAVANNIASKNIEVIA